jgi:hypothetical protein
MDAVVWVLTFVLILAETETRGAAPATLLPTGSGKHRQDLVEKSCGNLVRMIVEMGERRTLASSRRQLEIEMGEERTLGRSRRL